MDLGAIVQAGDCEAIGGGWLQQPASAWSSLAFVVVGAGIIAGARSSTGREQTDRVVLGALLMATGVGSFLFHGPAPSFGRYVHDLSFLAAIGFVLIANLTAATRTSERTARVIVAAGFTGIAFLLPVAGSVTNFVTAMLIVAFIASDVALWRRSAPLSVWYVIAIASLLIGLGLFAAGRTGSPLCDPEGLLQAHAGWHVFSAIFLGAYFLATEPARAVGAPT